MNIIEKLKSFNVEITAEIEKAFAGEFVSEREMEKKLSKLQTENETLKERAETAEETLKGFDGKNFDEITKERDEWKKKAEEAERSHNEKMAELEFTNELFNYLSNAKREVAYALTYNRGVLDEDAEFEKRLRAVSYELDKLGGIVTKAYNHKREKFVIDLSERRVNE